MNRMAQLPRNRRAVARQTALADIQHIVLDGVSWASYEQLLQDIGNRPIRINYDQGRMEMMSPLPEHDGISRVIARIIQTLSMELNIEVASYGSTTFRRRDKEKGLEPDECFYFKNEKKMRGRKRLNMKKDPPPELVVEIDITHRSIERQPIYAALGVPEIWRWDGTRPTCLHLRAGGYHTAPKSLSFPFLAPADLTPFIRAVSRTGENAVIRKFIAWVRKQHPSA